MILQWVRKKKNDSASKDKQSPLWGCKQQQYSWKEHMGQPHVRHSLNHPKEWNIWKTNKNAAMQKEIFSIACIIVELSI